MQRLNNFLSTSNNFLSLILKLALILLVVMAIPYVGITIYGNIAEDRPVSALPDMPDIEKAPYLITISTTGQTFLSKQDVKPQGGIYTLNGFYAVRRDKWVWQKSIVELDEYYWGKIIVERRVK